MSYSCALIILHDHDNRLLLQHRTSDAPIMPDYWAFFGGGVKERETPEEAVRREALEELGYELSGPRLVWEQDFRVGDVEGHMYVFVEPYYGDKSALLLREGQGWGWFKHEEISGLQMIDHDRDIVRRVGQRLEADD